MLFMLKIVFLMRKYVLLTLLLGPKLMRFDFVLSVIILVKFISLALILLKERLCILMKYDMYSVRDVKMCFGAPQLFDNELVARRYFGKCITTPGSMLEYAPSDYELYKVGTFDSTSGNIEPSLPEFVCNGMSFVGGNHD